MSLPFLSSDQVALDDTTLAQMTSVACTLVSDTASVTLRHFRQKLAIDNKLADGFDPVTEADRACERQLRAALASALPGNGFFGEEDGYTAGTTGLTWVVDPIDGTRSFISGVPLWGTLVGLSDGRRPVAGILYQPFTDELYCGSRLGGTLQHRGDTQTLACSDVESLADARLFCTSRDIFTEAERPAYERVAAAVRLERMGADCYSYALLAAGHADLVVEAGLQCYDIYALIPIIEAAGGVVTSWDGGDPSQGGTVVAAATPALHREALARLRGGA
ncbi:MAG: inositol monophosphatase family protein [Pseudomonadota bacterium]